jgi:hypothetical protein
MINKCHICKRVVADEDVNENKPEESKCENCHIKWLRSRIVQMTESIAFMRLELNAILNKKFIYSESESDDDDNYLDNNTN